MTSSRSGTSNSQPHLSTPIQFLKGVGPKVARLLSVKGIDTIGDAIFYFPRDYQDRSKLQKIKDLKAGAPALIKGTIISHRFIPIRTLRRPILEARLSDETGVMSLKWFQYNRAFFEKKFREHPEVVVYGNIKAYGPKLEIIHPDLNWLSALDLGDDESSTGMLPIYSETEGLHQKQIRKIVSKALELGLSNVPDELPVELRKRHNLAPIRQAIKNIHTPPKGITLETLQANATPEQKRLIFDELFKFELIIGKRRLNQRKEKTKAYSKEKASRLLGGLKERLPFDFTDDQKKSIEKIFEDLDTDKPMNRLLQGDVGCGKTLVAFCSTLPVLASGGQVAIMAPTEILAHQHLVNARQYLEGLILPNGKNLTVDILTGSTKKSQRADIIGKLESGQTDILIGTHSLIEDPVKFFELGLIIVDEQHRFGVDQRMRLKAKGKNPHILSLTATPIPRTLALTAYGDLDVSVIRELPKGRPDIHTKIFKPDERTAAVEVIKQEVKKGRQAYIIYPLVAESEKIDLANAITGAEELANGPLKGIKVGLLHGRMKPQEKADVMNEFKKGNIQVLVSTTVVEVGVDVPNSTVLLIEHAERFGLSQLHQLRGRIGRGTETSHCLLMMSGKGGATTVAFERLRAMEQTRDGFKLAELDLQIRGPGEFLGTRQSGELQFKYADLVRDQLILHEARNAAFDILKKDPRLELEEHAPLKNYMNREGHLRENRLGTA